MLRGQRREGRLLSPPKQRLLQALGPLCSCRSAESFGGGGGGVMEALRGPR